MAVVDDDDDDDENLRREVGVLLGIKNDVVAAAVGSSLVVVFFEDILDASMYCRSNNLDEFDVNFIIMVLLRAQFQVLEVMFVVWTCLIVCVNVDTSSLMMKQLYVRSNDRLVSYSSSSPHDELDMSSALVVNASSSFRRKKTCSSCRRRLRPLGLALSRPRLGVNIFQDSCVKSHVLVGGNANKG